VLPAKYPRQGGAGCFPRLLRRGAPQSPPSMPQHRHRQPVRGQPQPQTSDTPPSSAMPPPSSPPRGSHMWSTCAQTLASVPPQPPLHAVDVHPNACTRVPAAPRPTPSKRNRTARSPPRCGNERDREDRRAFGDDTTPRLKSQSGHLPQGPQTPILAKCRGVATSWPFAAASTCPHDPGNAAPALTYLFNHDFASTDVRRPYGR